MELIIIILRNNYSTYPTESLTYETAYFSLLVGKHYVLRHGGYLLTQHSIFQR
jgi:hypothetical protein